jgi:hypothetical protein
MNEFHTVENCTVTDCHRLHKGDVVRVVEGGPSTVGFMQYGEVTDQPTASGFTVYFPDGVPVMHEGRILDMMNDLTYNEAELDKVSV